MHPLHNYISQQLADRLKNRNIIVWYDLRREFAPFIAEMQKTPGTGGLATVQVLDNTAWFVEYTGSFLEVRGKIEPVVSTDSIEPLLVYVPGVERDRKGSMLMEIEKAGECYEPQLKRLARNVLRQKYTDGVIDDLLVSESVSYDDLARASRGDPNAEPPSLLKSIFHDISGNDAILTMWLVQDSRDSDIDRKNATSELSKLIRARIGLDLPSDTTLAKWRSVTLRFVLANEFRMDLACAPPSSLDSIPAVKAKEGYSAILEITKRLRADYPANYADLADRVENELGLAHAKVSPAFLGNIDTFRFEEKASLAHCSQLIAQHKFDEALTLISHRGNSFWLERDVTRKALWEACRRMAELGAAGVAIQKEVASFSGNAAAWLEQYTTKNGWHRLDLDQRRLETWIANLEEDTEERALAVVRRVYEDTCNLMAERFTAIFAKSNWTIPGALHQTSIQSKILSESPKPAAYFMVDAMRFEMGVELSARLPKSAEITLRPAVGALPSITPIGMAALLPGASANFSVIEQNGKLGSRIEKTFMPDLTARKKYFSSALPGVVDLTLDEVLSLQQSKLRKKVEGAQYVVVRSQEIDHAGETGFTFQARQVMDNVIDNLARAVRKLAAAGIEYSVISADHGHLFFPFDRDESMRIAPPGGQQIELHRRCWIGRGGSTPNGCIRVSASELGYQSDLEFVFPASTAVFRAGGDLAFHHGGTSLQELIIPVLSVQFKVFEQAKSSSATTIDAGPLPDAITNRIFSVTFQLGKNLSLLSSSMLVRPLLVSAGKQVGTVGMATGAEFERETGCLKLEIGKPATVAFLLSDENVSSLRVLILDPTTDAELYKSPVEIPVRLGV